MAHLTGNGGARRVWASPSAAIDMTGGGDGMREGGAQQAGRRGGGERWSLRVCEFASFAKRRMCPSRRAAPSPEDCLRFMLWETVCTGASTPSPQLQPWNLKQRGERSRQLQSPPNCDFPTSRCRTTSLLPSPTPGTTMSLSECLAGLGSVCLCGAHLPNQHLSAHLASPKTPCSHHTRPP